MKYLILFFFLFTSYTYVSGQDFDDYFTTGSMRVDFILAGDAQDLDIFLEQIKKEPYWGGTTKILTDPFDYGLYKFQVRDQETGKIIFSRGFSTLFQEWQTTEEAKHIRRSFYQVLTFPYPLEDVILEIFVRNRKNQFEKRFELLIDPQSIFIDEGISRMFPSKKVIDQGDPSGKADIVFLAEGYTEEQMEEFYSDVNRLVDTLFNVEPFQSYSTHFNIWAVASSSDESGTDIPGTNTWKRTVMNSHFFTFGSERYLTTDDYKSVRDIAANVPYDQIVVLVNTDKYGGGGIYNHYNIASSDNQASGVVLIHEFGHGFAGLGDEYFSSQVAYQDYYDLTVEPWEPNLTTLVDFGSKWSDMLNQGTPVPTPGEPDYFGKTGVFEGGGYMSKGIYRPAYNCRMRSNEASEFCEVCKRTIIRMIKYYTGNMADSQ